MWAVALLAAAFAARAGSSPAGLAVVDPLWAALGSVVVVLAASRARRWSWLVSAATIAVTAEGAWLLVAAGAVALAAGAVRRPRRRTTGAVVGACVVLVASHLPSTGALGVPTLFAAIASAPLLVSGYRSSPADVRRTTRVAGAVVAGAVVAVSALGALAALLAWDSLTGAESSARTGLEQVEAGDTGSAAGSLRAAAVEFSDASAVLGAPWARPARLVPVIGQHIDAAGVAARHGEAVAASAAASADAVDLRELRADRGALDVSRLRAAAPALRASSDELGRARVAVTRARSPWLVAPVADRLEAFDAELADAQPDADLGAAAAESLPGMLGADGKRRYLLAFTTPAEARGLGGFVGSWAVLEAERGRVALTAQGRAAEVNEAPGRADRRVTEPADYVARYGRFQPGAWFQDVSFSPDVTSSASAASQVFAQAGFGEVDGVVFVDPFGLAALLELTGPVAVPGRDAPLGADEAADWLLRGQYELDDAAREDLLGAAGTATFDALLDTELPGPERLGQVLGPPARSGRLAVALFDPGADAFLRRLGATRPFPVDDGQDLFALVTQNSANNKIDVYLQRSVRYEVTVDPGHGLLEARATVTLENTAPESGLPDAVLGSNDQGLPPGTNRLYLSWYSPLGLREARVDDTVTGVERQRELGWNVYSTFLEIPAGQSRTVELVLGGSVEPATGYRLSVGAQPAANPDQVEVVVRPASGWAIESSPGWTAGVDGEQAYRGPLDGRLDLTAPMRAGGR